MTPAMTDWHLSRSWDIEDPFANDAENPCGCGLAPCGAVDGKKVNPNCGQHNGLETIRTSHRAEDCPELERQNDAYMEHGQPGGRA